jgi:hypothetical protein
VDRAQRTYAVRYFACSFAGELGNFYHGRLEPTLSKAWAFEHLGEHASRWAHAVGPRIRAEVGIGTDWRRSFGPLSCLRGFVAGTRVAAIGGIDSLRGLVRAILSFLSLALLISCGRVVDSNPNDGAGGTGVGSSSGRGGADPSNAAGSEVGPIAGATPPKPIPAADGGSDANTPPKPGPAADGGSDANTPPKPGTVADGGTHSTGPLCNASADIRLTYDVAGGFVDQTYGFTNPYGHAFFLIDGQCHYYAGGNYMKGIATGTLTQDEEGELSSDLHWNELDDWTWGGVKEQGCPDAGSVTLNRAGVSAMCTCGCDTGAPQGLNAALEKAYAWAERLVSQGALLDTPVSAIVLEASSGDPTPQSIWPLMRTMSSIPNLIVDRGDSKLWMGTGPWARFDDTADISKLRQLRADTTNLDVAGSGSVHTFVPIQDGANLYQLYVRDELPDDVLERWDGLKATLPKP